MILGRPSLNTSGAVVSTLYLALKFLISPTIIGVIHADQKEARHYYNESLRIKGKEQMRGGTQKVHMVEVDQPTTTRMRDLDPREEGKARPKPKMSSRRSRLEQCQRNSHSLGGDYLSL